MKKQFNIGGVNVELSKKQLQIMVDNFDEEYYLREYKEAISLIKNDNDKIIGLSDKESSTYNLSSISRMMAIGMNDLMPTKEVLNKDTEGWGIVYYLSEEEFSVESVHYSTNLKHFKTKGIAEQACDLLNNYDGKIFGIQMKGGK